MTLILTKTIFLLGIELTTIWINVRNWITCPFTFSQNPLPSSNLSSAFDATNICFKEGRFFLRKMLKIVYLVPSSPLIYGFMLVLAPHFIKYYFSQSQKINYLETIHELKLKEKVEKKDYFI